MKFDFLDPELVSTAKTLISYFAKEGYGKVCVEKPLNKDDKFRPTLILPKKDFTVVVEVKDTPSFQDYFEDFVKDCLLRRERVEIYLAFPHEINGRGISYTHDFLDQIARYGIGVLVVNGSIVLERSKAIKCNMRISPTDVLCPGKNGKVIAGIVQKFNGGCPVDAIRDLTELFEDVVDRLVCGAARAKTIILSEAEVQDDNCDLEKKINVLSAPVFDHKPQKKYLNKNLSLDVKAFKGTRNLTLNFPGLVDRF